MPSGVSSTVPLRSAGMLTEGFAQCRQIVQLYKTVGGDVKNG